jgi:putative transposase
MAEKILHKTFRYRIYPTKRQEQTLNDQLAICCELYNAALQERRDAWRLNRKSISWFDQNRQLTEIKQCRADVAAVNANVLEETLKRVRLAFSAFFTRMNSSASPGYPRFRSVSRYDSITFRQIGNALSGSKLRLSKIGNVRIKLHRPLVGTIKTLTVKREAGRWFALFVVECAAEPLPFSPNTIGVDVGLTTFATLSDATKIENPRWFRVAQAKLRRLQRRVARRRKGSNRRRKAVLLLQRFHNHVRDQRRDFHHKASRKIVNANGLIVVEDLNIKGLAAGMLAKSVNDAGWANFLFMLAYKAESAGRVFVKVDPRGTSQTCICGTEVRKTLAERRHLCLSCGLSADRDHVSAQIILDRASGSPSGVNVGDLMPSVA